MSPETPVLTEEIDGITFPIYLTPAGKFWARYRDERLEAPTKSALRDKLRTKVRTAGRVKVPATILETQYDEPELTITQIHLIGTKGKYSALVYEEDTDPTVTGTVFSRGSLYRRLSPADIAEAQRVYTAHKEAEKAWEVWQEANQIDGHEVLKAAQDAALANRPVEQT
jgi:hypothetical protein